MTAEKIIVYDVETQKTFAEVGGNYYDKLLVSYLGVYSFSQDQFFGFFEPDLPKLEAILQAEQPTIIGFNSIHFDNNVVQPYFKTLQIANLPQIDILAEIHRVLGFRMKLESVAQATLGEGKSGSGLDAIRYFRSGDLKSLAKYCLDDVRLTRDLYLYGKHHGFILYHAAGETQRLPVSWSADNTVTKQLEQALAKHQRCHIQYLQLKDSSRNIITTTIDVLSLTPKTVEAFSQTSNTKETFQVERILKLEVSPETYAHQARLF